MNSLPSGTVSFLFTDIEGSTRLAQQASERWETLRLRHHACLQAAIHSCNGYVFQVIGDAFCAAFDSADDAIRAAAKAQQALAAEPWGEAPLQVRMGIHAGKAEVQPDGQYQGYLSLVRVQRLMSAGHGGQVLVSRAAADLVGDDLPDDLHLRDLGEYRLKDLSRLERIFQLLIPGLPVDFPTLRTLDTLAHNLPTQLTSFIGREKQIGEVVQHLASNRLVIITGTGGAGKSRLAVQVAAEVVDRFPHGAWLVELAPLTNPEFLSQVVTAALNVYEQQGRPIQDTLLDYLHKKELLLILDNCEHLVNDCASLADVLLHRCPGVKILATSRESLGILGEIPYHLQPLTIPDLHLLHDLTSLQHTEAVELFLERAGTVFPGFKLTEDNAPSIARVCRRLDGIPLAIELAAARVRMLSVEQIEKRLDDAFRLLTGGSRTALPRLQTLRALIDWSYNLLTESERRLFHSISVFSGGWTLEAAEAICQDESGSLELLDLLTQLVNKSLVNVEDERDKVTRYRILETVRQYASEKMIAAGGMEGLRDRHLVHFLKLVEEAGKDESDAGRWDWLQRLEREQDNLRSALTWVMDGPGLDPSQTAEPGDRLLAIQDEQAGLPQIDIHYRLLAARLARQVFDYESAISLLTRSLSLLEKKGQLEAEAGSMQELAASLYEELGDVLPRKVFFEQAIQAYQDALIHTPAKRPIWKARLYRKIAAVMWDQQRLAEELEICRQAETALGNPPAENDRDWWNEWFIIQIEKVHAHYSCAQWPEMRELVEKLGPIVQVRATRHNRLLYLKAYMLLYLRMDRYVVSDDMQGLQKEALDLSQSSGNVQERIECRFESGFLHLWRQELEEAEQAFLVTLDLAQSYSIKSYITLSLTYLTVTCRFRGDLDLVRTYSTRAKEAAALARMPDYVASATANQGWLAWRKRDFPVTEQYCLEAIQRWEKSSAVYPFQWMALWPLIGVKLDLGEEEEAWKYVRLLLQPTQQLLPKELNASLEAASRANEENQAAAARSHLDLAVALAKEMGYL